MERTPTPSSGLTAGEIFAAAIDNAIANGWTAAELIARFGWKLAHPGWLGALSDAARSFLGI